MASCSANKRSTYMASYNSSAELVDRILLFWCSQTLGGISYDPKNLLLNNESKFCSVNGTENLSYRIFLEKEDNFNRFTNFSKLLIQKFHLFDFPPKNERFFSWIVEFSKQRFPEKNSLPSDLLLYMVKFGDTNLAFSKKKKKNTDRCQRMKANK